MNYEIALLGGDGIGPEVTAQAARVLERVGAAFGHTFRFAPALIGGCAIDATGAALPDETLAICRAADAVLLGAVGGPKWDDPTATVRPEQGLLGIRKGLGLYANLRPVKLNETLIGASTIKPETLRGTDLVVVRELTGGIYFGERGRRDNGNTAYDTMIYTRRIERVLHATWAGAPAPPQGHFGGQGQRARSSRLWRETATVAKAYPTSPVSTCWWMPAPCLIRRPATFDVIVTENMFGDILTDEASMLAGSMGMLPSASLAAGALGL